jgi:DNA polymerase III delta subunit
MWSLEWGIADGPAQPSARRATVPLVVKSVLAVIGAVDAGPGDRDEMLRRAHALLEQAGADGVDRFDVPGKGASEDGDGAMRSEVEGLVPALQSPSLFGGRRGVLVVDSQHLLRAEAEIVADLVLSLDADVAVICFVSAGALPAPLNKAVDQVGEKTTVKKMRERDAADWLGHAARERRLRLEPAAATSLVQRFGSDIASMGQALDQLATIAGPITASEVAVRFHNRPDEPMWHLADAVAEGDTVGALRRLADFLTHGHPLALLSFLENDLRRRALAAAAPDIDTFAGWVGGSAAQIPVRKAWQARGKVPPERLRRALGALARADLQLKTRPEATHRLTMERLIVALCVWYGGRTRRSG